MADLPDRSAPSDLPAPPGRPPRLRPSGGYRDLRSFRAATVIYDATVDFCERFVDKGSRTRDQMVQAARSGRQNIAEGSRAAATSSQTELRLVNVARASLDELLLDYEDHLRQHGQRQWTKDDPEAQEVREIGRRLPAPDRSAQSDPTDHSAPYRPWLTSTNPEVVANCVICLIHQANYLLDQQIAALERDFVKAGGYSEQLAAARIAFRSRSDQSVPPDPSAAVLPDCPLCGKPLVLRTARKGKKPGSQFWGCSGYPECKGTRPLDPPDQPKPPDPSNPSDPTERR